MTVTRLETMEINEKIKVRNTKDLVPYLADFFKDREQENFAVICLDGRHNTISIQTVSVGTVNQCTVHPREVFRHAIMQNATAIIVSHNHPSDDTQPSDNDIETTKRLYEASQIVGIHFLDHIIISRTDYFSFVEEKLIFNDD